MQKETILYAQPYRYSSDVGFAELPEEEKQIGRRVRNARLRLKLTQGFLAPLIGLSRHQLNSVEIGRVPLRFDPALTLCGELDLNPLWLAYGEPPPAGFFFVDTSYVPDDELFSQAMEYVAPNYRTVARASAYTAESLGPNMPATSLQLSRWIPLIPPKEADAFWRELNRTARDFLRRTRSNVKHRLTYGPRGANMRAMAPYDDSFWPELRQRLRRITAKRGRKAALAKAAHVSRQAVSAWLSDADDAPMPNANTALFLREWVDAAEAEEQQKSGAHVGARAPRQTRKDKSTTNEKAQNKS